MFSRSTTASINCSVSGPEFSLPAVTLDAPKPSSRRFRRLPSGGIRASQLFFLHLLWSSKFESPVRYFKFGPSLRSNGTTMPSADFCNFFQSPLSHCSSAAKLQTSPGTALSPSRLCPPHIRASFPYRYRTLKIIAFLSSLHASYAISVRRASASPAASFRFHLAMDTLAVRLTIPPVGFVGDFHSLVSAPCRAHQ